MRNPEVQLLVYGKDIAHQTLEFSDGIIPKNITRVENPNYVFVTINTSEINLPKFDIRLKNGKKNLGSYTYALKQRLPHSAERKSFTSSDVMYLIMPDRFANGDVRNDSQKELTEKANRSNPNGRHGGDLRGIIRHLDYLKNLGATTLWLTPVCEDNEKVYSYHGYAQTDLYKIDGRYGTGEEYRELSRELKKRDMKLVMDYVTNHWGISNWIIQDLPMKDWIHQFTDGGEKGFKRSNYKTTAQFDTSVSDSDKKLALDGWFDTTMPDINQSHPLVLNYLTQNAIWWIEDAQLDGFRVDTYPYNDRDAMAKWAKAITEEYPNFNIVGETWMYDPAHVAFWQKDSKIGAISGYNSQLPSVMDFSLLMNLAPAFQEKQDWDKGITRLYNTFTSDFLYPDVGNMLVFFENHDTERWNEIFHGDVRYYKMALSLISTIRGIPQIYYGSEIGMRGDKKTGGDADIRRDFPGGWPGDTQNAFNPSEQTARQKEYYHFTQKLLSWRRGKEVIHNGKTKHYLPENGVYTYFRYNDREAVMVMINNSEAAQNISLSRFEESLKGFTKAKDIMNEAEFLINKDGTLMVQPKSSLILELQ